MAILGAGFGAACAGFFAGASGSLGGRLCCISGWFLPSAGLGLGWLACGFGLLFGCQDWGSVWFAFGFVLVVFFFLFVEIFFEPLRAVHAGDGAAVDDDIGDGFGFEVGVFQINGGGLQGVEHEAGGFVVDAAVGEPLNDFRERHLDGVGVFEHIELEARLGELVGAQTGVLVAGADVEEAEAAAAQGGRSALRAVDFQVLTAWYVIETHGFSVGLVLRS